MVELLTATYRRVGSEWVPEEAVLDWHQHDDEGKRALGSRKVLRIITWETGIDVPDDELLVRLPQGTSVYDYDSDVLRVVGSSTVTHLRPQTLLRAARDGNLQEVERLLAQGTDVNAQDDQRRTPLHLAAEAGHRAVVEALIEAGADANATDFNGHTATGLASGAGHDAVADLLREHGGVE